MPATDDDDRDERTAGDADAPPPGYGEPSTPGELAAMAREARRVAEELAITAASLAGTLGDDTDADGWMPLGDLVEFLGRCVELQRRAAGMMRLLAGAVEGRIREGGA